MPWRVIGVLKSKGQSGQGQDQDDTIVAPYTTVQKKMMGITFINAIVDCVGSYRLADPPFH
jgi:putative ABC transport system permease protein